MFRLATRSTSSVRNVTRIQRANITLPSAGATAESKTFGDREKGEESRWARMEDMEKLKALRDALLEQKKTTAELKERLDMMAKKHQKQ